MVTIADALQAFSSRQRLTLLGLLGAAMLWHLLLPGFFYSSSAVIIEGPVPSLVGAAIGVWFYRAELLATQVLAGCAGACLSSLVCLLVFGLLLFGPWAALVSIFALLRNGLRLPFTALPGAVGSPYGLFVFWMGVKTLLLWGAVGFAAIAFRRRGADVKALWAALSDRRVMSTDMRRRNAEYRALYANAVRAGETPPAPPPGGFHPHLSGTGFEGYVRLSYWVLRIGLALVAAAGVYATLGQVLTGQLGSIFLRGFFGG